MKIRTGLGYDVHRLEAGRPFLLGGIRLEADFGSAGHSDADVLIHAICDALLGAASLRDIGYHFPDNDPVYQDADSADLLVRVAELVRTKGYEIGNIDSTVVLEAPRVNPHIDRIRQNLAELLQIDPDEVSVKATTSEKMGFVGTGEGVAAYATVLIWQQ